MGISYNKLFELMEQKGIKKVDLRRNGLSPTIVDRLVKNTNVNTSTIVELCKILDCQPGDIMKYIPDEATTQHIDSNPCLPTEECTDVNTKEMIYNIIDVFTEEQLKQVFTILASVKKMLGDSKK